MDRKQDHDSEKTNKKLKKITIIDQELPKLYQRQKKQRQIYKNKNSYGSANELVQTNIRV